jgi:hypothetical protein
MIKISNPNLTVFTVIFFLVITLSFAQENLSFNEGKAKTLDYHGEILFENINGKIILPVTVANEPYKFILDTGTPTAISERLSKKLNPSSISKIAITDINQQADSLAVLRLNNIAIGPIEFNNIPALVIEPNDIFTCLGVDGFIGSNLLRNSVIQLNGLTNTLILSSSEKALNLNPKRASDLVLDAQSSPYISLLLKNKKKGVKHQVLLDLGVNSLYDLALPNYEVFQHYDIFEHKASSKAINTMGLFGMAKEELHHRLLLPELDLNGFKFNNLLVETTQGNNSSIGSGLLDLGLITVDYKNRKFYFDPFQSSKLSSEHLYKFPISYFPENKGLYIGSVWSPGLTGKISIGDQILAVDGLSFETLEFCDLINSNPIFQGKERLIITTVNKQGEKIDTVIERK